MTISGLNTFFDYPPCLPILFDQVVNIFSVDDFALDFRSHLLSYHRCYLCFSSYQAMNISSIDKPIDRHSCFTSLSTSSQTFFGIDTPWSYNPLPCYFSNSRHHFNMANSLKMINQELLQPKDWVSSTVLNSQKKFAELPTIDILMIGAAPFNMLM